MAAAQPVKAVKIALQFRERENMAYELNCSGTPLTVRVFSEGKKGGAGDAWRVEARLTDAADATVASALGATRAGALRDVGIWWRASGPSLGLPPFDWEAIAQAMSAVRAL